MIFEGDRGVIDAIKEKKKLMEAGEEHGHIRPLLFIDGGLMKGSYGAGAVLAMEELGYGDVFTFVTGVSSGAPTAAYFLAGQAAIGITVYYEESCSHYFINPWRFWNQVNTHYFIEVLRGLTGKPLDVETILNSPVQFYVAAAKYVSGETSLIFANDVDTLLASIQASILMPNISKDRVYVDGVRYVDGGFAYPHALLQTIAQTQPTHILFIANQDQGAAVVPWLERMFNHTLLRRRMTPLLRSVAHNRKRERLRALTEVTEKGIPLASIWGNGSIMSRERDSVVVKQVIEASRAWWHELLK